MLGIIDEICRAFNQLKLVLLLYQLQLSLATVIGEYQLQLVFIQVGEFGRALNKDVETGD